MPAAVPTLHSSSKGSARDIIEKGMLFVLVYLLSGFGSIEPVILSVVFYDTFALQLAFINDRTWLFLLALTMAVGRMFVEGLLSAMRLVA